MIVAVLRIFPRLGKGAVVEDVAVVGKAVVDETRLALFYVLLDRIEGLFRCDLHFRVRPARHFDDHVQRAFIGAREQWDVVEGRYRLAGLVSIVDLVVGREFGSALHSRERRHELCAQ